MASAGNPSSAARGCSKKKLHVFLTGRPGVGKTTAVRRAVDLLTTSSSGQERSGDITVDGFYTEERRERGRRVGFDIVTLGGERTSLADVIPDEPDPNRRRPRYVVGRYAVKVDQFERAVLPVMRRCNDGRASVSSSAAATRIAVVDEVGKMEAFSAEFLRCVQSLLETSSAAADGVHVLGTVPVLGKHYPAPLSALLRTIQSHPQCTVLEVTEQNRQDIPGTIVCLLFGDAAS